MDDMRWPQVCLISAACGDADSSSSGILIDNQRGIILSHASVLQPFLKKLPNLAGLIKSGKLCVENNISELKNVRLQITFERYKPGLAPSSKRIQALTAEVCNNGNITTAGKLNANIDVDTETISFEGSAKVLFKATQFSEAVSKLFPSEENWKFAESAIPYDNSDKEKSREDNENVAKLLPLFLIIKLKKWHKLQMAPLVICSEKDIKRGSQVNVVGTPFGSLSPMVFFNSVSQGIIANTVRDASSEALSLILTDARCIPGCEGGALFLRDVHSGNYQLAGVVAASLCWKANEWVGLSVVCPINELIRSLHKAYQSSADLTLALPPSLLSDNEGVLGRSVTSTGLSSVQPVVVVHCGAMWGSGIVVDWCEGIVLTCGHVVKRAADGYKVRVSLDGSIWRSSGADIVFVIKDQQVFDMALLRLQQPVSGRVSADKQPAIVPHKKLHEGEDVFVLGHGVFEDRYLPTWSMTSGIVSRVLRVNSVPVIVQSTCAVHPGASGGALVNRAGQLVGMVVCNAKDTVAGVCYPHINLSIPAETIWPAIEHYCRTKDTKELEKLRIKNTVVEKLWALAPTDQIVGPKSIL